MAAGTATSTGTVTGINSDPSGQVLQISVRDVAGQTSNWTAPVADAASWRIGGSVNLSATMGAATASSPGVAVSSGIIDGINTILTPDATSQVLQMRVRDAANQVTYWTAPTSDAASWTVGATVNLAAAMQPAS